MAHIRQMDGAQHRTRPPATKRATGRCARTEWKKSPLTTDIKAAVAADSTTTTCRECNGTGRGAHRGETCPSCIGYGKRSYLDLEASTGTRIEGKVRTMRSTRRWPDGPPVIDPFHGRAVRDIYIENYERQHIIGQHLRVVHPFTHPRMLVAIPPNGHDDERQARHLNPGERVFLPQVEADEFLRQGVVVQDGPARATYYGIAPSHHRPHLAQVCADAPGVPLGLEDDDLPGTSQWSIIDAIEGMKRAEAVNARQAMNYPGKRRTTDRNNDPGAKPRASIHQPAQTLTTRRKRTKGKQTDKKAAVEIIHHGKTVDYQELRNNIDAIKGFLTLKAEQAGYTLTGFAAGHRGRQTAADTQRLDRLALAVHEATERKAKGKAIAAAIGCSEGRITSLKGRAKQLIARTAESP